MSYRRRSVPQLSGGTSAGLADLAGASGRGFANAGVAIAALGDDKLNQKARDAAFRLEQSKENREAYNYIADKQNVAFELQKKESKEEAIKKGKLAAYQPLLEQFSKEHPLNTAGMDDDTKLAFGEKISELYKDVDKSYKYSKIWRDADGNDMIIFSDENGNAIKKPLGKGWDWNQSNKSLKVSKSDKTDGYVQIPSSMINNGSEKLESKTEIKGFPGTWVKKDEMNKYLDDMKKTTDYAKFDIK